MASMWIGVRWAARAPYRTDGWMGTATYPQCPDNPGFLWLGGCALAMLLLMDMGHLDVEHLDVGHLWMLKGG